MFTMGQPYKNNDIRTIIKQMLNLEQYTDKVPAEIEPKVQLVVDVNPNHNRVAVIQSLRTTNTTTATVYTTPTDKDFYLSSITLSLIKDVTSTSVETAVYTTVAGLNKTLLNIPGITLTVQAQSTSVSYPVPIKVDRGVTIAILNTTNVANIVASCCISGYTVDPNTYDMGILAAQQAQ